MSRISHLLTKIQQVDAAKFTINSWKFKGEEVVFTNGCFDILHKGHISYLAKAADLGSKLIVAINSDKSVKTLGKGENRPINSELDRAFLIASLAFVDLVLVFDDNTPLAFIQELKPSILVKGADYDPEETDPISKKYIVGSDFVRKNGGKVEVIDFEDGFSTSSLIEKMKN